jgi:hypothetical protein
MQYPVADSIVLYRWRHFDHSQVIISAHALPRIAALRDANASRRGILGLRFGGLQRLRFQWITARF